MSVRVLTQGSGGTGGESASIFITGLSESDTVSAVKDGKTVQGKWITEERNVAYSIPKMTSNTTPEGTVTVSACRNDGSQPWAAFGQFEKGAWNRWATYQQGLSQWIQYDFGKTVTVQSFELEQWYYNGSYQPAGSPTTVKVQVVVDGTLVDATDTMSISWENALFYYELPKSVEATGIRFIFTVPNDFQIGRIQVYGTTPKVVSGHIIPIKSYGLWTVTATNGEKIATQDVLVDAAVEYEIEMMYRLWLYREGDECEEVTGGWVTQDHHGTNSYTKNSGNLYINSVANAAQGFFHTKNKISLTGFTKLFVDIEQTGSYYSWGCRRIYVAPSTDNYTSSATVRYEKDNPDKESDTKPREVLELSIVDSSEQYIYFGTWQSAVKVYNVWLE